MTKLYHDGTAWQVPGKQAKHAARIDVPRSPAELAAWMNARGVPAKAGDPLMPAITDANDYAGSSLPPHVETHVQRAGNQATRRALEDAERKMQRAITTLERDSGDAICKWILELATPHQVERCFEALGARFHELRSEARK